MTALDAAAVAKLAEQLGIDPEEVASRLAPAPTPSITVGEHLEAFLPKLTRNTRRTYRTHLVRFGYGFGPVCDQACEPCLDPEHSFVCRCNCGPCRTSRIELPDISDQPVSPATYNRAAVEAVKIVARRVAVRRGIYENRRRAERGKPKKAADGFGAQESAVTAMRALCQSVPTLVDGYDGLDVPKPHRSGRERRPLRDHELLELSHLTGTGGDDPELDLLLFDFGLETGARRSGAYGLTVAQIRPQSQIIAVKDKYGREQAAPVSERLIRRLLSHAISRGGPECDPASPEYLPDSPVFYYLARGGGYKPITSRRFDTLHGRRRTWTGLLRSRSPTTTSATP